MKRAVLFDLDGVLIHSEGAWFALLHGLAERLGHPTVERADFDASFGQGVAADIAQFFPGETPERIGGLYDRHFLDYLDEVVTDPAARQVMQRLRDAGLGVAVVTNTPPILARALVAQLGLPADRVYGPGGALSEKPAPDMLLEACRTLGVEPAQAVMIGDSRFDREAAAAAGIDFVGIRLDGDQRIEDLAELPGLLGR